ncbi:hypothetical protein EZV62_024833 [Acer yangbiense]|uniref:HMA domain-containing protein n=1 Tax=Acer yangbiense TaxID=1000413 RepID=A0A5C7GW52_9ROSI|nr:hypothetical protein EZV62_024833 [Acer yangbiense]
MMMKPSGEIFKDQVEGIGGIDQVSVDGEKGTLTVVGDVDPVLVIEKLRKIRKVAEIVTVGPPKPPEPEKPKPVCTPLPPCCNDCKYIAVGYGSPDDNRICSIL